AGNLEVRLHNLFPRRCGASGFRSHGPKILNFSLPGPAPPARTFARRGVLLARNGCEKVVRFRPYRGTKGSRPLVPPRTCRGAVPPSPGPRSRLLTLLGVSIP